MQLYVHERILLRSQRTNAIRAIDFITSMSGTIREEKY